MTAYQPRTGARCTCRPGVMRDNCPTCEGTGWVVDFAKIRAAHAPGDRPFVCGTRRVERSANRPDYFRVVCATCGGGGTVYYSSREIACSAAVRDSARACPARPSCGAS